MSQTIMIDGVPMVVLDNDVHAQPPYVAPPAVPATLTFLQFMALFTSAEQTAVVSAADAKIKLFCLMASGAGGLQLSNAEVIQGVDYLATAGVITTDRATQILAGTAAPAAT